jgi:hypothetical protein
MLADWLHGARSLCAAVATGVAFLHELKKQTGDGRYLFPGRKGRPISTNALEVALNSLGYRTRIAHTASGRAPQPC